ncbi:MAG TPA: amidohydrolase family protein [Firmicutes bacterium]|nr:amidohydrolase family protein [Bacillota bacterium]
MEIFANHAHVFPRECRPEGTIEALLELMDRCHITRAVAFAPFVDQVQNLGIDPNEWLAQELERYDNIYGFGTIDPSKPDLAKQAETIARLGFKGVKLHPAYQRFNIMADKLQDFYAAAEELGLLLCFHLGVHWHRIKDYHPLLCDELAYFYPKLKFTMEHVGGLSFFFDALAVLTNNLERGNIYAGITSVLNKDKNLLWYLGPERMELLASLIGSEQMIFGLDFPYNGAAEVQEAIDVIMGLSLSLEDKANILGGNLARLLDGTN